MPFTFRRPTRDDAEIILDWRTRAEITRFMFTDIERDIEAQRRWLAASEERRDYEHFLVLRKGAPVGMISYSEIDRTNLHCAPGIYLVLEPPERHLAAYANSFLMDYLFYRLGMNKAIMMVMAENQRVIRARRLSGAREVGVLREHIFKHGRYHDVHMFEQTRAEWEAIPRLFPLATTLAAFSA